MPIDNARIAAQLDDLAVQVRSIDLGASIRMERLAEIVKDPNLEDKTSLNLYDAIDPKAIEASAFAKYQQEIRPVAYLELFRAGLVLAPIFFTWYGLWEAARRYQNLLTNVDPDLVSKPFLLLWEQGFGGTSGIRFSQLAGIDALLILGIIVLTLITQFVRDAKERKNALLATQLRQRLEDILWEVNQRFAEERSRQANTDLMRTAVVQFDRSAKELVTQMRDIKDQMTGLTSKTTTAYVSLQKSIQELVAHVEQSGKQQQGLVKALNELRSDITNLNGLVLRAGQQMQPSIDEIGQAASRISHQSASYNSNTKEMYELLEDMMKRTDVISGNLRTATGSLGVFSDSLVDTMKSVNEAEKDLTPKLRSFAHEIENLMKPLTQAAVSLDVSSQSLKNVADRLDRSSTQISNHTQQSADSFLNTSKLFADMAAQTQTTYESLRHLLERMDRVVNTLQTTTTNSDIVANGMSGIMVSLERTVLSLEPTLKTFSEQVIEATDRLITTADQWEERGGREQSRWQPSQWSLAIFATVTMVGIFVTLLVQVLR